MQPTKAHTVVVPGSGLFMVTLLVDTTTPDSTNRQYARLKRCYYIDGAEVDLLTYGRAANARLDAVRAEPEAPPWT